MFAQRSLRLAAACVAGWVMAMTPSVLWAQGWTHSNAGADVCARLPGLSASGLGVGHTNGDVGTLGAGESVTMTASLGTAASGSFRIVGDPGGVNTLAGPSAIPGTLTFTSNGTLPGTSIGVGYFIDAANGGTVNIAVTSSCVLQPVPTTSTNTLLIIAACLALGGVTALYLRRG